MPLTLPGLFDFSTGRNAAVTLQNNQAITSRNEALSFVEQLNALNTSLNTNDNLQFRNEFAQQDPNASILDRFSNIAATTQNPFLLSQAVTQQQALAPLLALNSVQNPFFGQQQGLPTTPQGALNQGLLGFNPIFQQQQNALALQTLAQNNPQLNAAQFGDQAAQTNTLALLQQQLADIQKQNADLQRTNARLTERATQNVGQATATTPNTAAPTTTATTNAFGLSRGASAQPLPATR